MYQPIHAFLISETDRGLELIMDEERKNIMTAVNMIQQQ